MYWLIIRSKKDFAMYFYSNQILQFANNILFFRFPKQKKCATKGEGVIKSLLNAD